MFLDWSKRIFLTALLSIISIISYAQNDLQIGLQYYEDGDYDKAIEYLEPLTSVQMTNQLYKALLNSYLSLKDYKGARKLNRNFRKKSRINQMELLTDLIYINFLDGDEKGKAKAVKQIEAGIKKNPSLAYSAANSLQKRGYPEIAIEVFDLAQSVNPNLNFDYQRAQLYGELGQIQKMYEMYVAMVERTPNYLASVKTLIAQGMSGFEESNTDYLKELLIRKIQEGGPSTMNELLIHVYIQEKNFRGAFTQLKAIDRRRKTNKAEIYNLGKVSLNSKEYKLSQKIFDYIIKAGKENPFYEDALVMKLEAKRLALEKDPESINYTWSDLQVEYFTVRQELVGYPEMGSLTIDLAHFTAFRLNDIDSAVALLQDLLSIGYISKETKARAKIELGDILLYSGERWEAILYYGQAEKAFEKSPIGQSAKFKRAKAAYFVGDFQWAQGIFDALKASTSKLIANDAMQYSLLINDNIALDTSTEAMKLYAKADLMHFQSKLDSSLFILTQIQKEYLNHSLQDEVLLLKARIWIRKKEYQKAADDLQSVVDHFNDGILADDALYQLAELFEKHLNRVDDAKELYRTLFTDHPDSFFANDARKKFRTLRGDILN